ncbi:cannabinoid receptor 1-like [Physella acuta]|uniref:cannabinoid receptor 1-like n=1 Tax=Physella acuta TaxID=109671 RepID=UPI0027DE7EDC|nr:cannabinoid receptor 1-like [Physella acuta]
MEGADYLNVTERMEGADYLNVTEPEDDPFLISADLLQWFTLVNYVALSGTISFIGVIFNIINIIIFIRLGFHETTNISFLSLTLADMGVVLMLVGYSIIYNPAMVGAVPTPQIIDSVGYILFGWPYACFSRIAGCMTAFITVERFLCVAMPLRIKTLVTPQKTILIAASFFVILFASVVPAFLASRLDRVFDPSINQTVVGLVFCPDTPTLENASLTFNVAVQLAVFIIVTVFTVGLIRTYVRKSEWRNSISSSQGSKSISSRDKKLVKMVIFISVIFIACSIPGVVATFLMMFIKDYNILGRYRNIYIATFSTFFPIGAINSTVNIFIFLDMSSKYRHIFLSMFDLRSVARFDTKSKT